MQLNSQEKRMAEWAAKHADTLKLKKKDITATYIYNSGGFVNQSFRLSDGKRYLHVKFADEQKAPRLKQWASIHKHLTGNYHAPQLVREVTETVLPGFVYGMVFEYLDGKSLDAISDPVSVIYMVLQQLQQLHRDTKLRAIGNSGDSSRTYADAFIDEYISRFEEDLQVICSGRNLLYFVSDTSLDWFYAEVEELKQIARRQSCFQQQAADVVHNDLNWQNILVNDNNHFWIIDWDDMTVNGDAAMDYSVLLWPLYRSRECPQLQNNIIPEIDKGTIQRMDLYFRAKLLDDVIDVLADYVEAESYPQVKEAAQKQAKETHLLAYADYLKMYVNS